jgi:fucose permease
MWRSKDIMLQRPTSLYLGSFVTLGCFSLLLGPSLDTFRDGAHVSTSKIGLLFTTSAVGYLIGALAAGRILETFLAHRVMGGGLLLCGVSLAILSSVHTFTLLALFHVLLGIAGGAADTTGNSAVLWLHKGGPIMNALHLCFGVGAIAAPMVVAQSLRLTDSLRAGYLGIACLVSVFGIVLLRTPSPANPHAESARGIPRSLWGTLALGVGFFVAYVGVEVGFIGWIFDYGRAKGFSKKNALWLGTAFLVAFTAGRFVSIWIARWVKPRVVLLVDAGICAFALVIILVGRDTAAPLWIGTVLFGFGTASMFPTMLSLAEPVLPSTSTVTSGFLAGSAIGSMTIPALIGRILDTQGPTGMPIVVLVGVCVCALIVAVFPKPRLG